MSFNTHCATCGCRLPDDRDEDGYPVYDYMCDDCQQAQDAHYRDGLAS